MPRPILATIDINALRHNLGVARQAMPTAKIWAVIKADAYGHGIQRARHGFADADGLALVELDNAMRLRELGWSKPILLLEGFFEPADLALVAEHRLQSVVHCQEQIEMLSQARLTQKLDIYLKLNTGMNRLGLLPSALPAAFKCLRHLPTIGSIALMTHFANAGDPGAQIASVGSQATEFQRALQGLTAVTSLANSAAILCNPEVGGDWIRPGIMLYGASPTAQPAADFGLQPAMTLESQLIGIQQIERGAAVGYGSDYVAAQPMRIGIVACGYADGYPRHAPTGTPILVDGVLTQLIGRVSMDLISVDLTPVPQAQVGSRVTLWGAGLPIDDVARAAGTIGYELMCGLARRVPVREI